MICGPADETRILMVQPTTRTPGEASRKWIRPALEHIGDQLAEDWRKLKGVPTVACANNQAWVLGVVVNPKVAIPTVTIQAQARTQQRRCGRLGKSVLSNSVIGDP